MNAVYIFILVYILSTIACVAYDAVKPDYTKQVYNFSPFPKIRPADVPSADVQATSLCGSVPQKCDPKLDCAMCGEDFVCEQVGEAETVLLHGNKVPVGEWCLPKGKRELGCGAVTGRAVWSTDPYTGDQQWHCSCLYPDLYNGPECRNKLACTDPSRQEDQSKNVLMAADGETWDPLSPLFQATDSPFAVLPDGTPKYTCRCNLNEGGLKLVRMPGDPYRCHADPCTRSARESRWSDETGCLCEAETELRSNVTGACIQDASCAWGPDGVCTECSEGSAPVTCESNDFKRPTYTNPKKCPEVPGGSYCAPVCYHGFCQNGSIAQKRPNPQPGESLCMCMCPTNPSFECGFPFCNSGVVNLSGKTCENSCILDDTPIPKHTDSSACCSNIMHTNLFTGVNKCGPSWIHPMDIGCPWSTPCTGCPPGNPCLPNP